uniref:N-carbamoylputrescine amidase n=1 Tax=Candidatus Kentrum sp. MB TaxID=2138164 RepID=A0A450XK04_9GAMM|nr:MAG: N-carbamoylputrescine amidase [Candidatus Kentron sp. MB]VFK74857.1 MAG: N-carbamoylputrescine amidase [Candidatus Kentron sp. MB]
MNQYPITKPRVALVQSHWRNDPAVDLKTMLEAVDRIGAMHDVDLICLPEFFMGAPWYFPGRGHLKGVVDDEIPGRITDLFGERARKYGTYILCGTIVERDGEHYYNTSPLLDDQGRLVGKARKIHRYSAEMLAVEQGTEQVLVDTPFGRVGVCVCSDFWIQEMPRMLALRGAEIICVPGASIVQNLGITRACIQANSAHNVCYTLYTSIVGKVTGARAGRTITVELGGYATITSPDEIIATLDDEEDVLIATLDMNYLRESRTVDPSFQRSLYWCLWGRQPERYGQLMQPYVGAREHLREILADYLQ